MSPKSSAKTYLVTGGNGYIGSHMCQYLHSLGHKVITIDNFKTSPATEVHQYATFYRCDISDSKKVGEIINKHNPDSVFHFAALALVGESEEKPFLYFEENTIKSIQFFKTCIENGIKNIIFSSTCATYGVPQQLPITEKTTQNPINSYGMSKLLIEKYLSDLSRHGFVNTMVLRYFNVAGSDPEFNLGENHDPETHLIPNLCKAFLSGKLNSFKLYGTDYETKDGTCVRDYVHVCDLVEGHYLANNYLQHNPGHHCFNLGSGVGYSNLDVIKTFEEVSGKKLIYEICPRREGDPPELWADVSQAREKLNFVNKFNLKDSITHTLNYLKNSKQKMKKIA
ncbi:MAG: UDP-glucose 4-epimerase GalE [Bdellovibrio sp.]